MVQIHVCTDNDSTVEACAQVVNCLSSTLNYDHVYIIVIILENLKGECTV